jgi:hypothetical protein
VEALQLSIRVWVDVLFGIWYDIVLYPKQLTKMNNRDSFFSKFIDMPYFTGESLKSAGEEALITENTLKSYVKRGMKRKEIIQLKRNIFV